MSYTCKYCYYEFEPDDETQNLIENGYINDVDFCDECDPNNFNGDDYPDYSDADPGL